MQAPRWPRWLQRTLSAALAVSARAPLPDSHELGRLARIAATGRPVCRFAPRPQYASASDVLLRAALPRGVPGGLRRRASSDRATSASVRRLCAGVSTKGHRNERRHPPPPGVPGPQAARPASGAGHPLDPRIGAGPLHPGQRVPPYGNHPRAGAAAPAGRVHVRRPGGRRISGSSQRAAAAPYPPHRARGPARRPDLGHDEADDQRRRHGRAAGDRAAADRPGLHARPVRAGSGGDGAVPLQAPRLGPGARAGRRGHAAACHGGVAQLRPPPPGPGPLRLAGGLPRGPGRASTCGASCGPARTRRCRSR